MSNIKSPYMAGDSNDHVLCDWYGDKNFRTYVVRENEFPIEPWRVALLMNDAFARGYKQAQADIRYAIGALGDKS